MVSGNSAAKSIGRIGGLAVALGIGAALASGTATGIAQAEADGSGSSAHDTSSSNTVSATKRPAAKGSLGPARTAASAPKRSAQPASAPTTGTLSTAATATAADTSTKNQSRVAPRNPLESAAAWTVAAAARKELDSSPPTALLSSAPVAAAAATPAAAAATAPHSLGSSPRGWVTGQLNLGIPGLGWPQTNNTAQQGIYGTDLGILWENGLTGKIQAAFGDTFSGPNMTGNWRSNVLLLSTDTNLTDGMSIVPTGYAYQFIPSSPTALFPINSETTIIPTSAVSVNDQQYVNYMSVKSWDTPGRWTNNYNAISMYNQATDKWVLVRSTIRSAGWFRSSTPYVPGSQNFQQAAYVLQPEDKVAEGETQYLYAFGTPSGRAGSAYLSRVEADQLTDLSKYEYWDGANWIVGKPVAAVPVLGDSTHSAGLIGPILDWANDPNVFGGYLGGLFGAKTGGNVSEMSVQYNEYLDKYVVLYGNGANNVVLRTADTPEGPWSDPVTIATSIQYPGLYAPMIHPWSGTGKLTDDDGNPDASNLYWNMSLWGNYNVVLMQTDLSPLLPTEV
jgi:hypothetical protein